MGKVRPFVEDLVSRVKNYSNSDKTRSSSYVDIGEDSVCRADGTTEDLLKCLVSKMREFEGDMMVCVSQSDLPKSDASLRAIARKNGISLRVKKKVAIQGIDDAMCIRISKDDRKKLMRMKKSS